MSIKKHFTPEIREWWRHYSVQFIAVVGTIIPFFAWLDPATLISAYGMVAGLPPSMRVVGFVFTTVALVGGFILARFWKQEDDDDAS